MTTTSSFETVPVAIPQFSVAGVFLEGLAARDFGHMGSALRPDVQLRALLPPGMAVLEGVDEVKARFAKWFLDAEHFELVEAVVGEIGPRLHMRWRVRLQSSKLGEGWFVVEQQAYADAEPGEGIHHVSLLCSGYCPERDGDSVS